MTIGTRSSHISFLPFMNLSPFPPVKKTSRFPSFNLGFFPSLLSPSPSTHPLLLPPLTFLFPCERLRMVWQTTESSWLSEGAAGVLKKKRKTNGFWCWGLTSAGPLRRLQVLQGLLGFLCVHAVFPRPRGAVEVFAPLQAPLLVTREQAKPERTRWKQDRGQAFRNSNV